MNFWEYFFRVLPHKPKQALAGLYWHVTRRKVRGRNCLRMASTGLTFPYALWVRKTEKIDKRLREFAATMEKWPRRPRFSIILHASEEYTAQQFDRSIESVKRQLYPPCALLDRLPFDFGKSVSVDADFVVPLRIGDVLSEAALFRFAETLQRNPHALILYGDQDELDDRGRRRQPWFKPRWNKEMFLAQDYLADSVAIEIRLARKSSKTAKNLSEILLAASASAEGAIVHVPHILCHTIVRADDPQRRLNAVRRHLEPTGATCTIGPFGTIKVSWPLPDEPPLVTIIIPTKDKIELLQPCVEGVLYRTSYDNFEILIVDNASEDPKTFEYLQEIGKNPKIRVLSYQEDYNFSAINNWAVQQAKGTYICLLNNDTEVVESTWLTEMMRYAFRPDVGAVGAKLLYEDGTIQHAGVVIGIGGAAGHAHRFQPADQPGYFRQPHVAQFMSAVTAACLVVSKSKFEAVGGLDEVELPIAFNDVDFCLKLEAAGWSNVYVPHAVLVHHESKSRGSDMLPPNFDRYRRELHVLQNRWSTKAYSDPLHNPNLERESETFVVRL